MFKDDYLIFEAYNKRLSESKLARMSTRKIGEARNDEGGYDKYVSFGINDGSGKQLFFYYDSNGTFRRGLLKAGTDLKPFRQQEIDSIAQDCKITADDFYNAINQGSKEVTSLTEKNK
ncbi:hypothetical protein EBZ39_00935 [bacterium]|nr:hypothetical protein [bacterium]